MKLKTFFALLGLSVASCQGELHEIVITCKTKNDPPYRFAFYSSGLAIFSRHEIRIVSPESAFARPHDHNAYLNQRYGAILVDSFDIGPLKFDSINGRVSGLQSKIKQYANQTPLLGVYFEIRGTPGDSLRYIGKLGDAPIFSDLLCSIFNDTNQGSPVGMLPYFKEEFGLKCISAGK